MLCIHGVQDLGSKPAAPAPTDPLTAGPSAPPGTTTTTTSGTVTTTVITRKESEELKAQ